MPSLRLLNNFKALIIGFSLASCGSFEQEAYVPKPYVLEIPEGFPKMLIPEDNPMTHEAVALGERLFFDPILSLDSTIACASCHHPSHAFSDTIAVSPGVHPDVLGNRNAYPLVNAGFLEAYFMEGGVPTLELQVIAPMGESSEMDLQLRDAIHRLKRDSLYVQLSRQAYQREIDPWVITRALAAYERTLISATSPFDAYRAGNESAISDRAKRGWQRFQDLGCTSCHSGPLFTNQGYFNIGLYESYEDPGRGRLTDNPQDLGKFRVPSLRNVAITYPYMHDGSKETIYEVIKHFASGGEPHVNKSPLVNGFEIDEDGIEELLAFLESLTDTKFEASSTGLNHKTRDIE